jgi:protein phosphatase/serine/threonine-protein phosphatase Stp1
MTMLGKTLAASVHLASVSRSHVGHVRRINEDRLLDRPDLGLWAVADGMGGHSNGDVAAQTVIDALKEVPPGISGYALLVDATRALADANAKICQQNRMSGSTIVVLLAREGHYACLWAGDSRAYMLRDGELLRLTHDHSLVQELADNGLLTEEERRHHPQANIVTRAIGHIPEVEIDRRFGSIFPQDIFLLCSDGLTTCVSDSELLEIIGREGCHAANTLLELALARGAPDNVSFVLVRSEMERRPA